jgi:hypothetical protein
VRIAPLGHGKKSANPKNILPSKRFEKFRKGVVFFAFVSFATKRNEAGGLGAERPKYIELCLQSTNSKTTPSRHFLNIRTFTFIFLRFFIFYGMFVTFIN